MTTPRRRAAGTPKPLLIAATTAIGRALARSLFQLSVSGTEHVPRTGGVLLAGNHSGIVDGPLVFFFSPRRTTLLTKAEVFVGPWARFFGWLGQIPVHRSSADRAALQQGLQVLRDGGALGVFPEGTRGSGRLETTTDGLAYLALRAGVPVVPIAVHGTRDAIPKGQFLPRFRAPVRVVFGPPVDVVPVGDPRARRTVSAAAEELRRALVAHLERTA